MIEREVKIRVPDLDALRPLLGEIGAVPGGTEQEINRILDTADGLLFKRSQILRVRSTGDGVLTWKGPTAEQDPYGHKTREELEVTLAAESVETLLALFERLGYAEVLRYDKVRESWRWQGTVIALDHLSFGDFVEIEGEASAIQHALQLLHLQDQPLERRSYPALQRLALQERGDR